MPFIAKDNNHWIDANNNMFSIVKYQTEEAARMASGTLEYCTMCEDCENCKFCSNCADCELSRNCRKCTGCKNCAGCVNCENCESCGFKENVSEEAAC